MSLLQLKQDPTHEHDASAEGEDYAKGSGYILWTSIAAFVLVSIAIGLFVMANVKPPAPAGEITQLWAHEVHTLSTPTDAAGVQAGAEQFDQVLVLANVRIRNQSDQPIVLHDLLTNARFEDGIHSSYAAGPVDYDRIFIAYPELKGLRSQTIARDTVISPGQIVTGMVISSFHVTKSDWAAHKDLSFTFKFKLHPDLVLTPKTPPTEI